MYYDYQPDKKKWSSCIMITNLYRLFLFVQISNHDTNRPFLPVQVSNHNKNIKLMCKNKY